MLSRYKKKKRKPRKHNILEVLLTFHTKGRGSLLQINQGNNVGSHGERLKDYWGKCNCFDQQTKTQLSDLLALSFICNIACAQAHNPFITENCPAACDICFHWWRVDLPFGEASPEVPPPRPEPWTPHLPPTPPSCGWSNPNPGAAREDRAFRCPCMFHFNEEQSAK